MEHINQGKLLLGSMLIAAAIWFLFLSLIFSSIHFPPNRWIIFGWVLGILCLVGGITSFSIPSEKINSSGNIIMYPFGKTTSDLENREVIDFNCASLIPENVNCEPGSVHGFISVDENDSIKNFPENFGYDVNNSIKATSGFVFSNSWDDLMHGRFNFGQDKNGEKISEAFWPHGDRTLRYDQYSTTFWSGSNEDGSTNMDTGETYNGDSYDKGTCDNWENSSLFTSGKGKVGSLRQTGTKWLSSTDSSCSSINKNTLFCVCKEKIPTETEGNIVVTTSDNE